MNAPLNDSEPVRLEGFGPQDLYKRREKIFTRRIAGFFQRLRMFTGWPLLLGYFCLPWLNFEGRQAVLFDLPARQFQIFSLTIWPQDLWLLGWLLMIGAFALFSATTMIGRLWCGYTCPQTVWTAIFMWVEQFAEGPRHQRVRLDASPWTFEKLRKRSLKHAMWIGWSFLTGLTFVGYFTPIRELVITLVSLAAPELWTTFWILFFTAATYFNAGWLREQVCIYMCPYARFQSAMIDADTLTVSYDAARGEPRGARKRSADPSQAGLGSCIDCQLCVQVCPTGIDIRDGLQYECIGCAQCIDACNQVMQQMNYPPGLIRYTSERALQGGELRVLKPRSTAYLAVTLLLCAAFAGALYSRAPLSIDVIRERGALYHTSSDGRVTNNYQLKVVNKSRAARQMQISINSSGNRTSSIDLASPPTVSVPASTVTNLPLSLATQAGGKVITEVEVQLCETLTNICVSERTNFFQPEPQPIKGDTTVGGRKP